VFAATRLFDSCALTLPANASAATALIIPKNFNFIPTASKLCLPLVAPLLPGASDGTFSAGECGFNSVGV
jgi:hypothetical protein